MCHEAVADPILTSSGAKVETYTLFALPGPMGLKYELYYNTARRGSPWADNLSYVVDTECSDMGDVTGQCNFVSIYRPDGSKITFSGGPKATTLREASISSGVVSLTRNLSTGDLTFLDEDGTTQVYTSAGVLKSIVNEQGIGWYITRPDAYTRVVTHTSGRGYTINYRASTVVPNFSDATITDPAGNAYLVKGLGSSRIESITYPGSPSTEIAFRYTLLLDYRLTEVRYNGKPYSYTSYITQPKHFRYGWATGTWLADGSQNVNITYAVEPNNGTSASVIGPLGHVSKKTFDGRGNITLISNAATQSCGATTQGRSYDAQGNLAAEVDNNGNTHTYNYAANGQLLSETEAAGTPVARTTDYEWDPDQRWNRLRSITVRGWRKTGYTYNAQQRLASESVTNLSTGGNYGQTLTTSYNYALYGNGMVQTMWITRPSPNGSDTDTYTYDGLGNLTSFKNGLGQTTTYGGYNGLGQPESSVGPNGDRTTYRYDARGRVETKTTNPNGSPATWTYAYDGFGLLSSLAGPDGQITTWNRDARMWVSYITHNDKDGTSTESFNYDADGNVLQRTVTRGNVVGLTENFHYDALGRLLQKVSQNGNTETYGYDGNGNLIWVMDPSGHTVLYDFDALNRVTKRSESGGASTPIPVVVGSINVPGNIRVPAGSTSVPYTVSWKPVAYGSTYVLQEQRGDGSWVTVQSGRAISWSTEGKASGTYRYRVAACNETGCSAWSEAGTFVITQPSDALPAILQIILDDP